MLALITRIYKKLHLDLTCIIRIEVTWGLWRIETGVYPATCSLIPNVLRDKTSRYIDGNTELFLLLKKLVTLVDK